MIAADLVVHRIGQLVTCEPGQGEGQLGILEDATVAALGGQIVWVGPTGRWNWRIDLSPGAVVVDAGGACVIPGFVDSHVHLLWAGNRADEHAARLRGQPYWGGGIMRSVRLTAAASDAQLLEMGRRRLRSFLRHGVTSLEARTGYGLDAAGEERLLRAAGALAAETDQVLVSTFLGAHVVPEGIDHQSFMGSVTDDMLPRFRGLAAFCDAWCDPGAFDASQCRRFLRRGLGLGYQLKLQASQLAPGEGPAVGVAVGATSVDQLNYLRDGDARLLAESSAVCVICPGTTVSLGLAGEGAARALAAAGAQLAIASDFNPGISCSENMFLMIGLACLELGLSPEDALRGATIGGARALRLHRRCGSIRPGKRCDLVVLDAESYLDIPYRLGVNLAHTVICHGRIAVA